jgi:hypothetical protein
MAEVDSFELNHSDLIVIHNVIAEATKAGVFQAGDLIAVGTVYEKIRSILVALQEEEESSEAEE